MRTAAAAAVAAVAAAGCFDSGLAVVPPGIPPAFAVSVAPVLCNLGEVVVGDAAGCDFTVANNGADDIALGVFVDAPFFVDPADAVLEVGAGSNATFPVRIDARQAGVFQGNMFVDFVGFAITLSATVIAPPDVSIVLQPATEVVIGRPVTLDASSASTPIVQYAWRIAQRPPGSSPFLTDDGAAVTQLVADRAGSYGVDVTVVDERGLLGGTSALVFVRNPRVFAVQLSGAGAVLHVRPLPEEPCGALDCYDGHCDFFWPNGTPTLSPLGVALDSAAAGTYRVDVVAPGGPASATLRIIDSGGAVAAEQLFVEVPGGARWEAFDIVVDENGAAAVAAVGSVVAGGACP